MEEPIFFFLKKKKAGQVPTKRISGAEGQAKEKVVLFPEIGRVKTFLSSTLPHSRCVSEYIFLT